VSDPIHLQPCAPLAERVLLPGDPGRALMLAETLLEAPKMFNHNRGLWGYTGVAGDGASLTIQSTGMGGPSAAVVSWELADLGAHRLLRVGTCGALDETLGFGDLVVASESIATDGTSRALGASERIAPSPQLFVALQAAAAGSRLGPVACSDLFYGDRSDRQKQWRAAGALAVEMESAALFAVAARRNLEAASLLLVSDLLIPTRRRISPEALREAELRIGEAALRALTMEIDQRPAPPPAPAHSRKQVGGASGGGRP
jgi:DeoD family purine-nucleoside phosphorylase